MTESPFGRRPYRIAASLQERSASSGESTDKERERYKRAGEIIAVQEGVIKELEPFDSIYSHTTSLLQGMRPKLIDYSNKFSKDFHPSRSTKRNLDVTSQWHFPNLLIPDAEEMVTVDFSVTTPVTGDLSRQTENDELVYALWYLKEYRPVLDRFMRRTPLQPRTLMETRVRRGETDTLEQVVADTLLSKSTDISFRVSRTHAEPDEAPISSGRVHSIQAKLEDPNSYLQTDPLPNFEEVISKRRYNWSTGKSEGPTVKHIDDFLRQLHLSSLEQNAFNRLEEVNGILMYAGYTVDS